MSGVNKVILLGNLGNKPELKQAGGSVVAKFSLATSDSWKDKSTGERKERTEWHRCEAWGRQAETLEKYCDKGQQIYVEGSIKTSTYEKNGEKRYSTDIVVKHFQFVGKRSESTESTWDKQPQVATESPAVEVEDEIPF